jgi:multiple sugar transport system substrate-binding protein
MKALVTLATVVPRAAGGAAADPYAQYRGTTLKVSWPALGHFNNAEQVVEEFEQETGINVDVEAIPYLSLRARHIEELSKPTGAFDLVSWVVMWKGEYVENGFLEPLQPFFDNETLADEDYAINDISKPYLVSGGMVGGPKGYLDGPGATLYGIPYGAETSILAYRKDIFEKYELNPPRTYEDLEAAITRLAKLNIPAMSSRGKGASNLTFAWLLHLGPFGGTVFDDAWEPVINSPQAIAATNFLRLVAQTGPEDMENFDFGHSALAFLTGDAAIYLDNFKIGAAAREMVTPEFLQKVEYLSHPTGRKCSAETGGFAIGIPANSQNKEAAFLLLQYLTSKEGDLRTAQAGGDPIRTSTFAKVQQERPESSAILGSLLCANTDWRPLIPEWPAIQTDILGPALAEVTQTDRPVQEIMDEAAGKLRAFMEEAGYYSEG